MGPPRSHAADSSPAAASGETCHLSYLEKWEDEKEGICAANVEPFKKNAFASQTR